MGSISICFVLRIDSEGTINDSDEESKYQNHLKPVLSFLYKNPEFIITLAVSGRKTEWLEKKHPEAIKLINELADRKQVEICGGGYYDPILPLLLPVDRVGQIEMLTTYLRKTFSKRPRGTWLTSSAWEPSLISSLITCGMDYVFLDESLLSQECQNQSFASRPVIAEECGKTIKVLALNKNLLPDPELPADNYVTMLKRFAGIKKHITANTSFIPETLSVLMDNGWLQSFLNMVADEPDVEMYTAAQYFKNCSDYTRSFIPSGSSKKGRPVKEIISKDPEAFRLYSRMIQISNEVNQSRGDKARKKAALEELWKAQERSAYWNENLSLLEQQEIRQKAYSHLLIAEKLIKEVSGKAEIQLTSSDFDMDGRPEYICRYPGHNCFITQEGGAVFELDVRHCNRNYAICAEAEKGIVQKKLFQDCLTDKNSLLDAVQKGKLITGTSFSSNIYVERSFSRSKHELQLETQCLYSKKHQETGITKKYTFTENGIQVQYIIRNRSTADLKCCLAVESSLAVPDFDIKNRMIEVIAADSSTSPCPEQLFIHQKDVSCCQVSDSRMETVFTFETNENAGLCIQSLTQDKTCYGNCFTFFWDIEVPAGYSTEKILFLNIKHLSRKALTGRR